MNEPAFDEEFIKRFQGSDFPVNASGCILIFKEVYNPGTDDGMIDIPDSGNPIIIVKKLIKLGQIIIISYYRIEGISLLELDIAEEFFFLH